MGANASSSAGGPLVLQRIRADDESLSALALGSDEGARAKHLAPFLDALRANTSVRALDVCYADPTNSAQFARLAKLLDTNRNIQQLRVRLAHAAPAPLSFAPLWRALHAHPSITHFSVAAAGQMLLVGKESCIAPVALKALLNALALCSQLQHLALSDLLGNVCGADTAGESIILELCTLVRAMNTLRVLHLSNCRLSGGMQPLVDTLRHSLHVQELSIVEDGALDPPAIAQLAHLVRANTPLRSLTIKCTNSAEVSRALATALPDNFHLTSLSMPRISINAADWNTFQECILRNTKLQRSLAEVGEGSPSPVLHNVAPAEEWPAEGVPHVVDFASPVDTAQPGECDEGVAEGEALQGELHMDALRSLAATPVSVFLPSASASSAHSPSAMSCASSAVSAPLSASSSYSSLSALLAEVNVLRERDAARAAEIALLRERDAAREAQLAHLTAGLQAAHASRQ